MLNFHLITLFPEVCAAYIDAGVLGRAQKAEKGKGAKHRGAQIAVTYHNPRAYTDDKHHKADDRPFGGGPGMVLKAEPILKAVQAAIGRTKKGVRILSMSPRGRRFDQEFAKELARDAQHVVIICGRYEGIDARVDEILGAEQVAVGDAILTGGELPALTIIDAVARHIPGVLGECASLEDERTTNGLTYTKPQTLVWKRKQYPVPEVLLSGHTAEIEKWRSKETN